MDKKQERLDRRSMLKRSVVLLGSLTAAPLVVRTALAGSSAKADFQYRDNPKNGNKCLDCTAYITDGSSCKIFKEPVSPNGWCMAFSKNS